MGFGKLATFLFGSGKYVAEKGKPTTYVQTDPNIIQRVGNGFSSLFNRTAPAQVTPVATPVPTPVPTPSSFQNLIQLGLNQFNPAAPLASQSAELARAAETIKNSGTKVDPLLPVLLAMRETRNGLDLAHETRQKGGAYEGVNNVYNFHDTTRPGKFVNYPDFNTAINGGPNPEYGMDSQGLVNYLLSSDKMANYRQTGNLNDFNQVFTPQSDNNPDFATLTAQLEELKKKYLSSVIASNQ
jgi:hypothetical protein